MDWRYSNQNNYNNNMPPPPQYNQVIAQQPQYQQPPLQQQQQQQQQPFYPNQFNQNQNMYNYYPPQQQQQQLQQQQIDPRRNGVNLSQNRGRHLMDEVKPYDDLGERKRIEDLADLYSIIRVTELLENAYTRDSVASQPYTEACHKLISQFKTQEAAMITSGAIKDMESFINEYNLKNICPKAYERLVKEGKPATLVHRAQVEDQSENQNLIVLQIVQDFITTMDALKLGQSAKDAIHPLMLSLMFNLQKIPSLANDFEGLVKLRLWLQKLNAMNAYEELTGEECRQLNFDLETSYSAFQRYLSVKR